MKKLIKKTALFLGSTAAALMTLVSFYGRQLPDFFFLPENGQLSVESVFPVTARMNDNSGRELMLFDTFPIKKVRTDVLSRPVVRASGQPFGIKLMTDGVMVVGLEDVSGECPASECGIRIGDIITDISGETVTTNRQVSRLIECSSGKPCRVTYSRSGVAHKAVLTPVYSGGSYKAGMWVRDSSAGIGTLTFYDPESGIFGGLGHPICDSDTKQPLPISHGTVGEVVITGCTVSTHGEPGRLLGEFCSGEARGSISKNTDEGVFGRLAEDFPAEGVELPLGFKQEAAAGPAEILSTINGKTSESYTIEIESVDLSDSAPHDMIVRVTDKRLLREAGGIVQGMSGSPIIQNGRLIGAVTHVFVDDPTRGYAIFADDMYAASGAMQKSEGSSGRNSETDRRLS